MRILLVEDDRTLAEGLHALLTRSGHAVDWMADGAEAEALARAEAFDLVVLDLGLPGMDGLDVLRAIRARKTTVPVLILTARDAPEDRVHGLDLGADDYLTKPFDVREFEARVRSLLRRRMGTASALVRFGTLSLDLNTHDIDLGGQRLDLPLRERGILELLILRGGRVVTRETIMSSLNTLDGDLSPNAIEQYASRLRKRLAGHGMTIRTARGVGYFLDEVAH